MKFMNMNENAVSPIVATLVLIVVAVVGAVAVGTIMGTFSNDVSDQVSSGDVSGASKIELSVAGSTTVYPVAEKLAERFMSENPSVKVSVAPGGSGAGIAGAGADLIDIGMASENPDEDQLAKFPTLQTHKIGASAVVVIGNAEDFPDGANATTQDDVTDFFKNATQSVTIGTITIDTPVYRKGVSGTEETFSKWAYEDKKLLDTLETGTGDDGIQIKAITAEGNPGVIEKVGSTRNSLGFVDYGFAANSDKVVIIGFDDGFTSDKITKEAIGAEIENQDGLNYYTGLTRPLNFLTNGAPSAVEKKFLDFALSTDNSDVFDDEGYFSVFSLAQIV
jgi:phosphate transport system substrate-binding protein